MTMRNFLSGLAGLLLLAPLAAQAEPPIGRLLASQCAQCHGTDGRAVGDMDSLAGEDELWEEMQEMKYSNDTGDIMHRQAKGYTEEQIRLIAQYYAGVNSRGDGATESGDSAAGGGDSNKNEYEKEEEHEEKHKKHEEHDD